MACARRPWRPRLLGQQGWAAPPVARAGEGAGPARRDEKRAGVRGVSEQDDEGDARVAGGGHQARGAAAEDWPAR
ncbi:hypothetical protein TCAP_06396 [Tolypocladium capitatum]|uniref:Uncharacterized protein n=1 Tax=Tolypocladium capitatum TaxID=45235 RepID=A0A2K3Q7W2_9HYPO|nr:hypothetical protein TCAP_06396 [Tolypocladium capitatum]